jgi:hypothetical protein
MKKKKYTHDEAFHNMTTPNIVVPIVLKIAPHPTPPPPPHTHAIFWLSNK